MRKVIIIFLAFTFIIGNPGLMLAAEEAISNSTTDSSSSSILTPPVDSSSSVLLESPVSSSETILNTADILPTVEAPALPTADVLVPQINEIAPAPQTQIVENLDANQAVNENDPQRDPADEEHNAYQQEKSANNSFKKEAGLTGQLRVDQFSGAASYNIGLEVPPGRSGFNPSLLLAYNSHDKSNDSWVGQGWSLPLGSISRTSKKGSNNLYTANEFTLFLGGSAKEIIEVDAQNHLYAPKEESDYLKIQYLTDSSSWLVTDTNGVKYYFGQTSAARQDDPADQNKIFKWNLDKVLDTNDNFYKLEYAKRNGAIYPSRIVYTGHGQTDGPMEILFNLEERGNDNTTSYQTQFLVTTNRRLNNIEIKVQGQTITRYQLAYTTGQNNRTSLLSSITKKAYDIQGEHSLPATTFNYSSKQSGWTDATDEWQDNIPFNFNVTNPALMDFNGDSWTDMGSSFHNGRGWEFQNWNFGDISLTFVGDLNGDKLPDAVAPYANNDRRVERPRVAYLNNGVNGFNYSAEWSAAVPEVIGYNDATAANALVDINGDGLADIVHASKYGYNLVTRIYLNNGHGWVDGYGAFPAPLAWCDNRVNPLRCYGVGTQIVDFNGDGLSDVLHSGNVYLNTGAGFEQEPNQQWSLTSDDLNLPQYMHNPLEEGGVRVTDLNGDGLLDLTIALKEWINETGRWVEYFGTWLNTGNGWQRDNRWNLPMVIWTNDIDGPLGDDGIRMMDINNDNAVDLVQSYRQNRNLDHRVYLGSSAQANQLTSITNGYGGETNLEYQLSGQYFTEDNHFKNPRLPLNLETVKTIATADGQGNEIVTNYDYQDGAYYGDPVDYTLNQYAGFGVVTSTTGDQTTKTYYHQGSGIDGYANGEYEDTIYKKGRAYREEVYQDVEGQLVLQTAKVSTWKQNNLDHDRKYVYLDGTVAYDYTAQGEQQQQLAPGNLNQAQAVNQQAIQQSLAAQTLSANQLTELSAAQTFSSQTAPQLVSQSEDGLSATYYLGRNEAGQQVFQYQAVSGGVPQRDENEAGQEVDEPYSPADGQVAYNGYLGRAGWEPWDTIRNAQEGDELNYRDHEAILRNNYGYISRVFLPFNTSNLPADITITGASLTLSLSNCPDGPGIVIVNSNQHVNSLEPIDYSSVGNTSGGTLNNCNGRYAANLNQTGRSWIDPHGWTKLALRGLADFNNQRPQNNGRDNVVDVVMSEDNDQNRHPLLTVNFYYNNITPGVPTNPQVESQVNPEEVENQRPAFSAIFNDENQDDQAAAYQLQVIRATNLYGANNDYNGFAAPLWDSGRVEFDEPVANGQRSANIQYNGGQLPLDGRQYFWRIKFWDNGDEVHSEGLWSDGQDYFFMDGSAAPVASINLLTESRVEPRDLLNQNPSFSAIYRDPNPIDSAKWYQVQVDDNNDFSSPIWNSEKQELHQLVDNGVRSEEIQYGGEPLAYDGTLYYWRIKFWDDEEENGTEGAWSEAATFSMFNSNDVLNGVQAKAAKFHYDFTTGNLLSEENLGEVKAAPNGVFLNTAEEVIGDEKNSSYTYAEPVDESVRILAAPKEKVITNPNTEESSTVTISYDGRDDNKVVKANPTKEDLNAPQTVYQKTFNDFGLVTSTLDPLNHQTAVTYDNNNYYPATTRNHLNQTTQTTYDLATGQIKRAVDPNGVVEERDYDAFGRLVEVRKTNPASTNLLIMQRYEYHDTDSPSWVRQISYPGQSFELSSYSYFDGLGRTIQTRVQTSIANQYQAASVEYDEKGNTKRTTLVILANGSAYQQPDWNSARTEYTYDAQNRVLTEEFIGDNDHRYLTAYEYDGWNVTVTDANGNLKKLYQDAYGQLIHVDEYLNDEVYSSKYEYNLLGKLIKITDSRGNLRNFTYDELGRLISQEEMRTPNAQEFGVWSYEYDSASNLVSKTDPKGQVTTYSYDALNRILTENYTGQDGVEVAYTYDTGAYGKGRLYRVASSGAATTYTYDKWGRVTKEAKTINNFLYNTQWAYNLQSVPTSITYPDSSKVYYSYNKEGLPIRLRTAEPGQSILDSMAMIDDVTYSPLKQIQRIQYTNGTVSENTFDPVQAYRLTHKSTVNGFDEVLQDLTYSYDAVGNIIRLVDQSATQLAKTTAYEYDDLYRLTKATVTGSANNADYEQTYSYDIIGNILNKSDIGEYLYQNANPYQTNRVAEADYAYDQNGNLTADSQKTYHYNYADRLMSVDVDQNNVLYNHYDQSGQRTVKQSNRTIPDSLGGQNQTYITKTTYPNAVYEEETQGLAGDELNWQTKKTRHITLGNQTIAHIDVNPQGQSEKILVFSDHLGSSSLLTDSMGRVKTLYDYYPFGSTRLDSSDGLHVSAYQYTGKELDVETGLNYYGARYYEAATGRFTQPDPVTFKIVTASKEELKDLTGMDQQQLLENPQSLNSYAYVENNPVKMVDENGEFAGPFGRDMASGQRAISNFLHKAANYVSSQGGVINKVSGFVTNALADTADHVANIFDPDQKATIRVIGLGLTALDVAGGGDGKVANKAVIKAGETIEGLKITNHAAEQFVARNMNKLQIKSALEKGVQYLDTETNNILHVVGERGKGGYTIVTDRAQKVLVSTENFIRNLVPKGSPNRFKLLE